MVLVRKFLSLFSRAFWQQSSYRVTDKSNKTFALKRSINSTDWGKKINQRYQIKKNPCWVGK